MPSKYTFTRYSPEWPQAFQQEAERLQTLLGELLLEVHHIGSTSVPGLAAKPTIDLLPVVRDIHHIEQATGRMNAAGYRAWGEYGLPGRRLFTRDRHGWRTHNLHCYQQGDPEIDRHIAFCAYLRSHPHAANEYAELKRKAYAAHPADIAAYNRGKEAWIKALEPLALAWYRHQAAHQNGRSHGLTPRRQQ